jgi:hypothetical protein
LSLIDVAATNLPLLDMQTFEIDFYKWFLKTAFV